MFIKMFFISFFALVQFSHADGFFYECRFPNDNLVFGVNTKTNQAQLRQIYQMQNVIPLNFIKSNPVYSTGSSRTLEAFVYSTTRAPSILPSSQIINIRFYRYSDSTSSGSGVSDTQGADLLYYHDVGFHRMFKDSIINGDRSLCKSSNLPWEGLN